MLCEKQASLKEKAGVDSKTFPFRVPLGHGLPAESKRQKTLNRERAQMFGTVIQPGRDVCGH